jgi:hypothetical protein
MFYSDARMSPTEVIQNELEKRKKGRRGYSGNSLESTLALVPSDILLEELKLRRQGIYVFNGRAV